MTDKANVAASVAASLRFEPYPAYKDSDIEWLGKIPGHWDTARMWRISTAASGGTPSKDESTYWDGSIPWVSPKDMKRRFLDSSEDTVTERAIAETGIKLVEPPGLLIVVRGMILAHTFPVAITTVPVTINQDMKALHFRQGTNLNFMAWLFEGIGAAVLASVVEEAAHGTRAIRMDQWRQVTVPIPPEAEQSVIVTFIDRETARIDALVAKKERLAELLQEKRTALITRAVTKGLDANIPMKDSGVEWLGEMPAHWEVAPLKALLRNWDYGISESLTEGGEIRVLTMGHIQEGEVVLPEQGSVNEIDEALVLRYGDLLFNRTNSRELVGKLGVFRGSREDRVTFASYLVRMSVRTGVVPEWLNYLLNSAGVLGLARSMALLSVNQANLNPTKYSQIAVPFPHELEQRAITTFLDRETARLDALAAKVREAIDRLKELRTALISAAVTGKIDVRGVGAGADPLNGAARTSLASIGR